LQGEAVAILFQLKYDFERLRWKVTFFANHCLIGWLCDARIKACCRWLTGTLTLRQWFLTFFRARILSTFLKSPRTPVRNVADKP